MNTPDHANHCRRLLIILRVACFIASAALLSMDCGLLPAQEQQSRKTQNAADSRAEQLSHEIELAQINLQNLHEQLGKNDPRVARAQKELETLLTLARLSQEPNERTKAETASVTDAINKSSIETQTKHLEKQPEQTAQAQQLQQVKEQLAERENQMAMLAKQMMEQQRQRPLPPLENGQLKVYSLVAVPARSAAQTIESLFGSQVLRIAVDERSNSLIVYGKADSLAAVEALLSRLDEKAAATSGGEKSKQNAASAPRSLLLRLFWLADNLPEGVGQTPSDFLPKSVLLATKKLGLESPRLVTQTVNSLAIGREDAGEFSTNVPAVLLEQPVDLNCEGRLKLVSDDRVRVEMKVSVGGPGINCDLRGSLAAPLGHYMVLGTANSVIAEGGSAAGGMGGGPGMMPGGGPAGPEGGGRLGIARPGNPFGGGQGPGAGAPGFGRVPAEGAAGPGGAAVDVAGRPVAGQQPAKPNINTSRFAFVVQVIEGQSYPAENVKSDGEGLPPAPR